MAKRIGILGIMHESNTFAAKRTCMDDFRRDALLTGEEVQRAMQGTAHEVGGFFSRVEALQMQPVPLMFARAVPAGPLARECCDQLAEMLDEVLDEAVDEAGPLDGVLCALHGAAVGEGHADFDGWWLTRLRERCGRDTPLIATCDPHANMTDAIIQQTDALIAYRSNPHVDQHDRGCEAATLLHRCLHGHAAPTQAWAALPLAINIERQNTAESPCRESMEQIERLLSSGEVLSASFILGFPFADVGEMGAGFAVATDGDRAKAQRLADQLAASLWSRREQTRGQFTNIEQAMELATAHRGRVCLLDMGDNIGGGSPGDGTALLRALAERGINDAFVCICDPQVVQQAVRLGRGASARFAVGGKTDDRHGQPVNINASVQSFTDGRFREAKATHGGYSDFDQGDTAILAIADGPTVMVTTRACPPWSLAQLTHAGLDPISFRVLVAKGVNAPIAAYEAVCDRFIKVDTPGCTSANMNRLQYEHRRRPMYPFEEDTTWERDC